ncbi:hypothetical protein [Comamonas odontotermitis]|uniref:hypothetical protein n=1 Tax=Comamonas odontotermitis TaxID=379895 RepID=UPI003751788F
MTTPDPSREAFEQWRNEDRRRRIPEIRDWNDEEIEDLCSFSSDREWEIWQAAVAHMQADRGAAQNGPESLQTRMDAGSTVGPNPGWQSIETAPSYTTILVLGTSGMVVAYKDSYGDWKADGVDVTYDMAYTVLQIGKLTHWAPLPAAPKQEGNT